MTTILRSHFWGCLGLEVIFEATNVKISNHLVFMNFHLEICSFLVLIKFQKLTFATLKRPQEILLMITLLIFVKLYFQLSSIITLETILTHFTWVSGQYIPTHHNISELPIPAKLVKKQMQSCYCFWR